jgi:long-chain acyl-CoA synthetase
MSFLERIVTRLNESSHDPMLGEVRGDGIVTVTGGELLAQIGAARQFLRELGLRPGDRCGLLAANSIRRVAMDIALLAEAIVTVPLYYRQAAGELATMMRDSGSTHVFCGDEELRNSLRQEAPNSSRTSLLDDAFRRPAIFDEPLQPLPDSQTVIIVYTSGTSGEPKGVMLTAGNVAQVLGCTSSRLDLLVGPRDEPERIFHYLPFSFAASWILLLSALSRRSVLLLSTDLNRLPDEIRAAHPEYFLNVPALLERMRRGIEEQMAGRGGIVNKLFEHAEEVALRGERGNYEIAGKVSLILCRKLVFPKIRQALGPRLKALICGSAPLAVETQKFFQMLGISVLQSYGLTETTGPCTMDDPRSVEAGRVGPAIPGVEMKLSAENEILVRGPNIFPGYWNRPEATAQVLREGWFHTGDQGEVDGLGNWRIVGRLKNLIILNSGHNIAPEHIEENLLRELPGAEQVMLVGNDRSYLAALITGDLAEAKASRIIDDLNRKLPHYQQVRAFRILHTPFTVESGHLTANGKLRRDVIGDRFRLEIEELYRKRAL